MRRLAVPLLTAVCLVLAGCGSSSGVDPGSDLADAPLAPLPSSTGSGEPDGVTLAGDHAVMVTVDAGDGSEPELYTLSCPGEGEVFTSTSSLPDADAACAHLRGLEDPFAEVPGDAVCTEQYGGPQTAVIAGRWAGAALRLELSRADGCRIAQWDRLAPLLPVDVG